MELLSWFGNNMVVLCGSPLTRSGSRSGVGGWMKDELVTFGVINGARLVRKLSIEPSFFLVSFLAAARHFCELMCRFRFFSPAVPTFTSVWQVGHTIFDSFVYTTSLLE